MRATRFVVRVIGALIVAVVVVVILNAVTGTILFANAQPDPLKRADAIVVLGGEHDGREQYAFELAEAGYAPTVFLSDPYWWEDPDIIAACRPRPDIEVLCKRPVPLTTRGEAMMTRDMAEKHGWHSVIVISWRFHLPRARKIFSECFASPTRSVIMRDVPRRYDNSVVQWQLTYLYQYVGWLKAEVQGPCT